MNKKVVSVILKILCLILINIVGFCLIASLFNIFRYSELKINGISSYVKETFISVSRFKMFFIILELLFLASTTVLILFSFFKRKILLFYKKDKSNNWYRNEIDFSGVSLSEFNNKFLVSSKSSKNENNPNWLLKFNKKLNKWWINEPDSDINSVVLGGVGSGKTQRILVPNIIYNSHLRFSNRASFLISDPKKEIIKMVGQKLKDMDYKIYAVDFSDVKNSVGWNPLAYAYYLAHKSDASYKFNNDSVNNAISEINNVIEQLPWGEKTDDMWTKNAKLLIRTIVKFLLFASMERPDLIEQKHFNLITVASMCNQKAWNNNENWIAISRINASNDYYYWKELYKDIESIISIVPETLSGIFSNAISALNIFTQDEFIKKVIKSSYSFDLSKIAKENSPVAIFVHYPDHKPSNHFLVSMLIDQTYQALINEANETENLKLNRKFFFMLDEAGNLPPIINLDNKITISRSRNVFFQLVLQDYNQLKKYNSSTNNAADKVIRSNLQFTYFLNSNDEQTLKELSESLGKKEVVKRSSSKSTNFRDKGGSFSESESKEEKPLMSVSEIKAKEKNYVIIQKVGYKPMILKTLLAYKYFSNDGFKYECNEISTGDDNEVWDYKELPSGKKRDEEKELEKAIKKVDKLEEKSKDEKLIKWRNENIDFIKKAIISLSKNKSKIISWKDLCAAWKELREALKGADIDKIDKSINDIIPIISKCIDEFKSKRKYEKN
ncbi:type IV secretory system conjugative DNA transfer family protein [Mycoplasma tauri]|uniref:type IV secretory system conjugative DNA transfer family protein n=1 Tax=Mycoplasma tauri TaxID=547987 RepID=UPI001967D08C|nr:type IV secretory system conjugative DNA transfer family protein [Mycoplasma tauri]QSB07632.1 type IV secretory system conjugative DNA transfer family protein [Mycoplasma tauri]